MPKPSGFQPALLSIALLMVIFPFAGWAEAETTVKTSATYAESADLAAIRKDLSLIDEAAINGIQGRAVIVGKDIKARDIYRTYLKKASEISGNLLNVRQKVERHGSTLTLQQLGALSQRLSTENTRFRGTFRHGEEDFQTYKLIQTAVTNLEDAITYWRIANHYRPIHRGSLKARTEDDEVLRTKIQTALNAIDELKAIIATREALSKDLADE